MVKKRTPPQNTQIQKIGIYFKKLKSKHSYHLHSNQEPDSVNHPRGSCLCPVSPQIPPPCLLSVTSYLSNVNDLLPCSTALSPHVHPQHFPNTLKSLAMYRFSVHCFSLPDVFGGECAHYLPYLWYSVAVIFTNKEKSNAGWCALPHPAL